MVKERLTSLDVFRGFTIIMMIIVNNPGNWTAKYSPLEHSDWNGFTPTDLIFPSFIFILGAAIPFAMPNKKLDGTVFNKILVRSLRIFCLGLYLNFFNNLNVFDLNGIPLLIGRLIITFTAAYALLGNFSFKIKAFLAFSALIILLFLAYTIPAYKEVRIPGVLQRIGIVYFFASILYLKSSIRTQILTVIALLLGYWAMMTLIPVPGFGAANLEKGTNLAAYIDSLFLKNHMWNQTKTWDPEGILITIPVIASGIIGILAGELLNRPLPKIEIFKKMTLMGLCLVILGLIWNIKFPINKLIWSSSFALYTSGLATLILCFLYYFIDIAKYKKWAKLFLIWGLNPIIVFFFSGIIPRVLTMTKVDHPVLKGQPLGFQSYFYNYGIVPHFENAKDASLTYALIYVIFWSIILWLLHKYKLFFKV